jgi:hypothetical protein
MTIERINALSSSHRRERQKDMIKAQEWQEDAVQMRDSLCKVS